MVKKVVIPAMLSLVLLSGCTTTGNYESNARTARNAGTMTAAALDISKAIKEKHQCVIAIILKQIDEAILGDMDVFYDNFEDFIGSELYVLVENGYMSEQEGILLGAAIGNVCFGAIDYITDKIDGTGSNTQENIRIVASFLLGARQYFEAGCGD